MLFSWCRSWKKNQPRRWHVCADITVLGSRVIQEWYKLCITNSNKMRIKGWYQSEKSKKGHYLIKDPVPYSCRHLLMLNPIHHISISVSLRTQARSAPELLHSGAGVDKSSAICFRLEHNGSNGNLLYAVKSLHSLWRWAWKFRLTLKNDSAGGNCKGFITCIELSVFFSDGCQASMLGKLWSIIFPNVWVTAHCPEQSGGYTALFIPWGNPKAHCTGQHYKFDDERAYCYFNLDIAM